MDLPALHPALAPLTGPDRADAYMEWLHAACTPFHAVAASVAALEAAGFVPWQLAERWTVVPGDRRYIVHPDGKSLIALVMGERSPCDTGYALVGAHTDSPDLRLRLHPVSQGAGTVQLTTQFHGGLIRRSWLDRPLALAGALYQAVRDVHGKPVFHPLTGQPVVTRRLVHVDEPLAVIPDLAIHLDREKNDKGGLNPQTQLNAVLASGESLDHALPLLADRLQVDLDALDGFDLHLVPWHKPQRTGLDGSLVTGPRHDDLAMVWSGLTALLESVQTAPELPRTRVAAFFDAEETGSMTSSGAASSFLRDVLVRVARHHPLTDLRDDPEQALGQSVVVSADMAHAHHPNWQDLHDKQHAPRINQGVVVKANASDRYATTGETTAMWHAICDAADAPVQAYVVRQDLACGTTIGPITAASLGARVVDVGCPMWAMHSSAETLGVQDLDAMVRSMRVFLTGRS
jgi:aspartyl aminopeptidase